MVARTWITVLIVKIDQHSDDGKKILVHQRPSGDNRIDKSSGGG